jgi:hypothetical protein
LAIANSAAINMGVQVALSYPESAASFDRITQVLKLYSTKE